MGTAAYMAPEQVRGEPADARTDIFAFGAVLYEMLSGERAFRRDTPAETMTAVLREEPPELVGSGRLVSRRRSTRSCGVAWRRVPGQTFSVGARSFLCAQCAFRDRGQRVRQKWWPPRAGFLSCFVLLALLAIARSGSGLTWLVARRPAWPNASSSPFPFAGEV